MIEEASKYKCRYVGNVPHALVTPFWNTDEVLCVISKFWLPLEMAIKVHAKITSGNKYSAAPSNFLKKKWKKMQWLVPPILCQGMLPLFHYTGHGRGTTSWLYVHCTVNTFAERQWFDKIRYVLQNHLRRRRSHALYRFVSHLPYYVRRRRAALQTIGYTSWRALISML